MESNNGEIISVAEPVVKAQENRQINLNQQLNTLDMNRPDHQVLNKFFSRLYEPKNYNLLDEHFSKITNIRYQPKCALLNNITNDVCGIYEYQPIVTAVDNLKDNFNIFQNIEGIFSQLEGKSTRDIVSEVAKIVTEKTNIPVFFEEPSDDTSSNKWHVTKDGNLYSSLIKNNAVGISTKIYQGNPEIISDIKNKGYSEKMDYTVISDAIIINNKKIDNLQTVQTILHELGHIDENRNILPIIAKGNTVDPDKKVIDTEVISSLYGLKTCMLIAKSNPELAIKMMESPITIYNWVLTGTTAP